MVTACPVGSPTRTKGARTQPMPPVFEMPGDGVTAQPIYDPVWQFGDFRGQQSPDFGDEVLFRVHYDRGLTIFWGGHTTLRYEKCPILAAPNSPGCALPLKPALGAHEDVVPIEASVANSEAEQRPTRKYEFAQMLDVVRCQSHRPIKLQNTNGTSDGQEQEPNHYLR